VQKKNESFPISTNQSQVEIVEAKECLQAVKEAVAEKGEEEFHMQ